MSAKRERRGVGDANTSGHVHLCRIPWGSCSVRCVCSEGGKGGGLRSSSCNEVERHALPVSFLKLLHPTDVRNQE